MGFSSQLINSHAEDAGKNRLPMLPGDSFFPAEGEMAQEFWMEQQTGWLVSEHNAAIPCKSSLSLVVFPEY